MEWPRVTAREKVLPTRRNERPGSGDDVTDRRVHLCDIVIPTRNRPAGLVRCLEGLLNQTMQDFGVVVVDDCSDTPPREIVERFAELDITLVELPEQSGPAAARNAGVDRVTAELVIFLDDDVLPDHRFVAAHLETVGETARSAVPIVSCGPFVEPADWDPTPWNLWEARQAKKEADAMLHFAPTWRQFHTGNNCLPTATFRKAGGFNESFKRAEDDESPSASTSTAVTSASSRRPSHGTTPTARWTRGWRSRAPTRTTTSRSIASIRTLAT